MRFIYKIFLMVLLVSYEAYARDVITIYSTTRFTNDWGVGPIIKKIFEKEYNTEIKFIAFDGAASIINRLKFEKNNPKADVVLGFDATQLSSEYMRSVLSEHNIDTKRLDNLPIEWTDKFFIPYNYAFLSFIYRDGSLKTVPKNFKEMIESKENFKIAISNPRSSDTGFDLLSWTLEVFGDDFEKEWKKFNDKITIFAKNWSDSWNLCMLGEVDIVLSYDTSAGYHKSQGKEHLFKEIIFDDGHMIHLQIGAKTKKAANRKVVQEFLEFLFRPEIQSVMLKYNYTHPVVKVNNNVDYNEINKRKVILDKENKIVDHSKLIKRWLNAVM